MPNVAPAGPASACTEVSRRLPILCEVGKEASVEGDDAGAIP